MLFAGVAGGAVYRRQIVQARTLYQSSTILLIGKMSLLMPLAESITYAPVANITLNTTFLLAVHLLALATHPVATFTTYSLYGANPTTNPYTNSTTYSAYQLQIWNASAASRQLIDNVTILSPVDCSAGCEVQVSDFLLLIEDKFAAYIFELYNGINLANSAASVVNSKTVNHFSRQTAIYKQYAVRVNSTDIVVSQYTIVTAPTAAPTPATVANTFNLTYTNNGAIVRTVFNGAFILWASNTTNVKVSYICFTCFIGGQRVSNFPIINPPFDPSLGFQMSYGTTTAGQHMLWVSANSNNELRLYTFTETTFTLQTTFTSTSLLASSSSLVFLLEGTSYTIRHNNNFTSFTSYPSLTSASATKNVMITVGGDSKLVSTHDNADTHTIRQYQLVGQCETYVAVQSSNSCVCSQYSGIFCQLVGSSGSSSGGGVPMGAIIGGAAAGGMVLLVVVGYCIWKKTLSKGAKRIPYVYSQTDLMAFQC